MNTENDGAQKGGADVACSALLGCPFCGGEANISKTTYDEGTVRYQGWGQTVFFSVRCMRCGADNRGLVGHRTEAKAAEKWNTRANPECKHPTLRFVQSASGNESWYECVMCGKQPNAPHE